MRSAREILARRRARRVTTGDPYRTTAREVDARWPAFVTLAEWYLEGSEPDETTVLETAFALMGDLFNTGHRIRATVAFGPRLVRFDDRESA